MLGSPSVPRSARLVVRLAPERAAKVREYAAARRLSPEEFVSFVLWTYTDLLPVDPDQPLLERSRLGTAFVERDRGLFPDRGLWS